jgi:3-hydroxybutyryl-CoA dehydrogenase
VWKIDTVLKWEWVILWDVTIADFIGLDVCLAILNVMYDGLKSKYACPY